MRAHELAIQNFAIAEHLLQLYQLFRELKEEAPNEELRLAVCRRMVAPDTTAMRQAVNQHLILLAKATAPVPQALLTTDGVNFLLRQAVVVACTALESFFWDALRENVLTIVRARKRGADESLKKLTLTLDDYMSIEGWSDPDERLQQIILKNFERGTLYNSESIERVVTILTVKNYWDAIARHCGMADREIRRQLDELINRRNLIAHRADRPDAKADPPEEIDGHGLRAISYPWVNTRVSTAKNVVEASCQCIGESMARLEHQLAAEKEQRLAQEALSRSANP